MQYNHQPRGTASPTHKKNKPKQMALIITKSSEAQQALRIIKSFTDATERLDGIEVADADVEEVQMALWKELIVHIVDY